MDPERVLLKVVDVRAAQHAQRPYERRGPVSTSATRALLRQLSRLSRIHGAGLPLVMATQAVKYDRLTAPADAPVLSRRDLVDLVAAGSHAHHEI